MHDENDLGNKKGKNRPSLLNFSGNSYRYEKAKKQELHNRKYAKKKWEEEKEDTNNKREEARLLNDKIADIDDELAQGVRAEKLDELEREKKDLEVRVKELGFDTDTSTSPKRKSVRTAQYSNQFEAIPHNDFFYDDGIKSNNLSKSEPSAYREGTAKEVLHVQRERNSTLVKRKKEERLKSAGKLDCEVCGFDFLENYGERGEGFIECHHIKPLSESDEGNETKINDLALLCANCHRMVHVRKPWLSIEELKSLIGKV